MKYIDSGTRNPTQTLGHWLQQELIADVTQLRCQSGFFGEDGLPPFASTFQRLAASNSPVNVLIGSNDGETVGQHVSMLIALLGLPRSAAKLGVVYYSGAYYHPKIYHIRRSDGTQAAYVGSANLTFAGVSSAHIEAGMLLDTRDGDPPGVLDTIAGSVDEWFSAGRLGMEQITEASDVTRLLADGVLSIAPPPRPTSSATGSARMSRPRLRPLVRFPPLAPVVGPGGGGGLPSAPVLPVVAAIHPAVPRSPFPPYALFAPGATTPTTGTDALSGASLPGGNVGLVIRLSRDSSRHWRHEKGTANISIPVPTMNVLRFGMYRSKYERPRAEYALEMRYVHAGGEIRAASAETNVMLYGFAPGESGHGDVRLLVPASQAREILEAIDRLGLVAPNNGDVALLEWPSFLDPSFKLTLLQPSSREARQADALLNAAAASAQLVGQGACWLPDSLSPAWS